MPRRSTIVLSAVLVLAVGVAVTLWWNARTAHAAAPT